jgi:hypothetical protein
MNKIFCINELSGFFEFFSKKIGLKKKIVWENTIHEVEKIYLKLSIDY